MGFQDVAFILSRTGFSTPFLENCGIAECLEITTCIKSVVVKQGNALCNIFLLQQRLFCVS